MTGYIYNTATSSTTDNIPMEKTEHQKITIGISSCLLGERVRFDSGHKKNAYITGVLSNYFDFHPFCPEVAIGLSIPRETIRLVKHHDKIHCEGSKTPELNVTDQLYAIAEEQKEWHKTIFGYIVKKDSPSCGMERVKVYSKGAPSRIGQGLYTQQLMKNFPHLPIEEEGRLEDAHLRENFIQRVYVYARWQAMMKEGINVSKLQQFHAQHKYLLMSHNQSSARELGILAAESDKNTLATTANHYLNNMMVLLKKIATRKNHVNTLQHIQGYLKTKIDTDDKAELNEVIEEYRQGLLPLIVPITLLRHHFRKHPNAYITQSYYMAPHPGELMLMNRI